MSTYTLPVREVPRGCLLVGSKLNGLGTISRVSLTAYEVEWSEMNSVGDRFLNDYGRQVHAEWISFDAVHGKPEPVTPLVVFG